MKTECTAYYIMFVRTSVLTILPLEKRLRSTHIRSTVWMNEFTKALNEWIQESNKINEFTKALSKWIHESTEWKTGPCRVYAASWISVGISQEDDKIPYFSRIRKADESWWTAVGSRLTCDDGGDDIRAKAGWSRESENGWEWGSLEDRGASSSKAKWWKPLKWWGVDSSDVKRRTSDAEASISSTRTSG